MIRPTPRFAAKINAGIQYWHNKFAQYSESDYVSMGDDHAIVARILEFGVKCESSYGAACGLLNQIFVTYIFQYRPPAQWLPIFEQATINAPNERNARTAILHANYGRLLTLGRQLAKSELILCQAIEQAYHVESAHAIARANYCMAMLYIRRYEFEAARSYAEAAVAVFQGQNALKEEQPGLYAVTKNTIGLIHRGLGEYELSLPYFRETIEIHLKHGRNTHAGMAYRNLGAAQSKLADYQGAEQSFAMAATLLELTQNQFEIAQLSISRSLSYINQEQWKLGIECLQKVDVRALLLSGYTWHLAAVHNNLAYCYWQLESPECEYHCREAISFWEALGDELQTGNTLSLLSQVLYKKGEYDSARQIYLQAKELLKSKPDSVQAADSLTNLEAFWVDKK